MRRQYIESLEQLHDYDSIMTPQSTPSIKNTTKPKNITTKLDKKPQEPPQPPSETPKAVYMRNYRAKRRQGLETGRANLKIDEDRLNWAREQRSLGRTFRSIASELGVDHSYLARRIKQG